MTAFAATLSHHLALVDAATTTNDKGKTFEDLICAVFLHVPGVSIAERNVLNAFNTEEVDVAIWNDQAKPDGIWFLPTIVLVECKNWSAAVGSMEVSYFVDRLESRGCNVGILLAANGITGDAIDLGRAHSIIARAIARGTKIIVVTRTDVSGLASVSEFVTLMKRKLCELAVCGTVV